MKITVRGDMMTLHGLLLSPSGIEMSSCCIVIRCLSPPDQIKTGIRFISCSRYQPGNKFNQAAFEQYTEYEGVRTEKQSDGSYILASAHEYRANMQSDACPNGFNQENVIRNIFLNAENGKTNKGEK